MRTKGTPGENQFSCTRGLSSSAIHILVLSDGQILKSLCQPVFESGSRLISCRVREDVGLGSAPEGAVTDRGRPGAPAWEPVWGKGGGFGGERVAWLGATVKPHERGTSDKWSGGRKPEVILMETVSGHRS